jgi:hypothetical protein
MRLLTLIKVGMGRQSASLSSGRLLTQSTREMTIRGASATTLVMASHHALKLRTMALVIVKVTTKTTTMVLTRVTAETTMSKATVTKKQT